MGGGTITKYLKYTQKSLCVLLFFFAFSFLFAQTVENQTGQEIDTQITENALSSYQDETRIVFDNPEEQVLFPEKNTKSGIGSFVRMVVALLVIIGCIYLVFFLIRRGRKNTAVNDAFLKKAASLVLSPGKSIHIITLLDRAYLIGAAENAINLLGEIQDKELVDTLNLNAEQEAEHQAPDFASLLSLFTPKQRKTENADSQTFFSNDALNTLKGHKGRLGKKLFDEGENT